MKVRVVVVVAVLLACAGCASSRHALTVVVDAFCKVFPSLCGDDSGGGGNSGAGD